MTTRLRLQKRLEGRKTVSYLDDMIAEEMLAKSILHQMNKVFTDPYEYIHEGQVYDLTDTIPAFTVKVLEKLLFKYTTIDTLTLRFKNGATMNLALTD